MPRIIRPANQQHLLWPAWEVVPVSDVSIQGVAPQRAMDISAALWRTKNTPITSTAALAREVSARSSSKPDVGAFKAYRVGDRWNLLTGLSCGRR